MRRTDCLDRELLLSFFRSGNLLKTAWHGADRSMVDVISDFIRDDELSEEAPLSEFYNAAYKELSRLDAPEYVYKNALISRLVYGVHSPATTSWIYEMKIGSARADAILINGSATVFEIKSDLDDFSRAHEQIDQYYSCFDKVVFVVGPRRTNAALEVLPSHVGVLVLSDGNRLKKLRDAKPYRRDLCSESIFHLFLKHEREAIKKIYGIFTDDLPPVDQYLAAIEMIASESPEELSTYLVRALRERLPATKRARIATQLPDSLRAAAFGYKFRKKDWSQLKSRLDRPVGESIF